MNDVSRIWVIQGYPTLGITETRSSNIKVGFRVRIPPLAPFGFETLYLPPPL